MKLPDALLSFVAFASSHSHCFRISHHQQHSKKKVVKCSPTQSAKAIKFELLSSSIASLFSVLVLLLFFFSFLLLLELGNVRVSRSISSNGLSFRRSNLSHQRVIALGRKFGGKLWQKRGRCLLYNYFFARTFLVHYLPLCSVGRLPPLLPLFFSRLLPLLSKLTLLPNSSFVF